ncbi:MAG TPA: bifunctional DNA primase/polymerase, partial [Thermoplasmata archaeon]|nr:bifunctional DNA primase/polymerase [Thermoplasmata archaeon]
MSALLDAALGHARADRPVFPVKLDKTPHTPHGFKDATADEAQIWRWWTEFPDAGIGMPTGAVTGFVVLDVDPRHGGDESLEQLVKEHGPLPGGPVVRTGGGGRHIYFAHPGGGVPSVVGFRPGLDLRADGGYVVLPPSPHKSGAPYAWVIPLESAEVRLPPPWLLKVIEERRATSLKFHTTDGKVPKGKRHDFIVRTAAAVASRFEVADRDTVLRLVRGAVHEAMEVDSRTDDDVVAAVDSAMRKYGRPTKPPEPAPPLEEFDPEVGEVFATTDPNGKPDLGVAWVADGRIVRTTVTAELDRIEKKYAGASQSKSSRSNAEASEERGREVRRLVSSLPFARIRDALWPLPSDPTAVSVAEWERDNGPLLPALERYFRERDGMNAPDGHLVRALWAMGASARSDEIDFAPRLMFEAPFGWGKSTAAEAVQLVVPRGVYGAALTPAAVYRMMNGWHPVLLVDESAIHDNPDFLRVLRTGFKRGAKIIRAAQNQDSGVVTVDPFGWVILTTQIDTKEDLVSRCFVIHLSPGVPEKRVTVRDPEATAFRTILTRLRLDILTGAENPDIGAVAETARSKPGLEPRSRDKLTALWPFAVHYGVEDRLATAAGRLEEEATEQLAGSDKGLIVAAIAAVVERAGGLTNLKASDLELRRIHEQVETLLVAEGEATTVPVFGGGTAMRVDLKRFGPRDFTARIVRELGFTVRTVKGRARIERLPFVVLWPSVWSRYGGNATL